jgi:DNA-directed RNA polymerase specialized sigma24 family protein
MDEEPQRSLLWIPGAQRIKDAGLREKVVRAAERAWSRVLASSDARLYEAVDASQILDQVVDGAITAHGKDGVRDFESYLFVGLVRKAAKLFRRERKVEYRSPQDLAALPQTVDTDWVPKLETDLQVKELVNLMDERTRCIYVMRSQGHSPKEIKKVLGMTEAAVRMSFDRGIARVRRRIEAGKKTKPGPST